ncbi:MAG: hypothetical protein AB8H47_14985 [Bacteroidia bacterium]
MRIYTLIFLSLFCFCTFSQAQTEEEWKEWERLFDDIDEGGNSGPIDGEVGLLIGKKSFDASMKRQLEYYGNYKGLGLDVGGYFQKKIVGSFSMRFSLIYSQFQIQGQATLLDSISDIDINMGLLRFPIYAVFTIGQKRIQPELFFGFNMGHLIRKKGFITYRNENLLPEYWASTITSGLVGGLNIQAKLGEKCILKVGGEFSLIALNPFDRISALHLNVSMGYRL